MGFYDFVKVYLMDFGWHVLHCPIMSPSYCFPDWNVTAPVSPVVADLVSHHWESQTCVLESSHHPINIIICFSLLHSKCNLHPAFNRLYCHHGLSSKHLCTVHIFRMADSQFPPMWPSNELQYCTSWGGRWFSRNQQRDSGCVLFLLYLGAVWGHQTDNRVRACFLF